MARTKRSVLWGSAALAAALAAILLMRPQRLDVETAAVDGGPVRVTVDASGETRVRDRYVVSAPLTGLLDRREVEVGDSVATGAIVAQIGRAHV